MRRGHLKVFGWKLVLQKVPSEDDPEVRNHGEGPYVKLGPRRKGHKGRAGWLA